MACPFRSGFPQYEVLAPNLHEISAKIQNKLSLRTLRNNFVNFAVKILLLLKQHTT